MMRSLPNYYFSRRGRCRSPLRGLYGQSDGAGKACGRLLQSGALRQSTASARGKFAGFPDQICMVLDLREDASPGISDQSNWRMDQCTIHMDGARTMLHQLGQTSCPFLPQLNVIQCTDGGMAAT
ncbi:hypothetical protein IVA88_30590 [Bradyrhizobium sp. 149]|uniref:hypothetical protein n=1 Tax=Bradyrhizobium sp. 149 TaxID=2782624 RepID=UPI001FFC2663|nr:hypothetical protein [Bradyrhizobium sp. 149]MCK1655735.1 hypothetical protein [Bradyrhizobium sp. 149]